MRAFSAWRDRREARVERAEVRRRARYGGLLTGRNASAAVYDLARARGMAMALPKAGCHIPREVWIGQARITLGAWETAGQSPTPHSKPSLPKVSLPGRSADYLGTKGNRRAKSAVLRDPLIHAGVRLLDLRR